MDLIQKIQHFLDALIHPSVQADAMMRARHRAFIVPRLLGGVVVLAMLPVYLAFVGAPGALEAVVFAWLLTPIALACFVSATGRYEAAYLLSSIFLTGLVTTIAMRTGGIQSFALMWLVIVPLEASLSASRRVVAFAAAMALSAAILLFALGGAGLLPAPLGNESFQTTFMTLGIVFAIFYAAGLAMGAESLARINVRLLSAEEERYRLLTRNMSDVISRHGRNGIVEFISPAAEAMLGVNLSKLHGHGLFDRVMVADRPAYLTALADAAASREAGNVEFRLRREERSVEGERQGSSFIWVEMRCHALEQGDCDKAGGAVQVVAVMRDITERKAQEEALQGARQEAESASAAKGRFLATMSHELRTPLNAIIGFSEMLMREEEMRIDAARRAEYSKLINDSGHHLLSVVNGILDMSKMESGNFEVMPEPFDPRESINNCCDLIALKARERGLDLTIRMPDALPPLNGDRRAFKQILFNLLSNAVKFTESGGHIGVSAEIVGARLKLVVADSGVGIAADDIARLGDPFFQAGKTYERRFEGTGLGLSIVKGLVALHGGEFQIESKLDEGTNVTVWLPLDCASAPVNLPASDVPRHAEMVSSAANDEMTTTDKRVKKRA